MVDFWKGREISVRVEVSNNARADEIGVVCDMLRRTLDRIAETYGGHVRIAGRSIEAHESTEALHVWYRCPTSQKLADRYAREQEERTLREADEIRAKRAQEAKP